MYEIKDDCYEDIKCIVKKIAKYAEHIEEALEESQMNHRARKEWDEDEEEDRKYKGTKYSRY